MAASDFLSGGSSVIATKKIDALVNAIIQLYRAERLANRDSTGSATNFVTWGIAAAAQQTFTAALNLPARLAPDVSGKLQFKARDFVRDYFTFVPGTDDLVDTENLPQAVVEIAEQINYWEKQIESNLVINQANQVTISPNKDTGTIAVNVSLPIDVLTAEGSRKGKDGKEIKFDRIVPVSRGSKAVTVYLHKEESYTYTQQGVTPTGKMHHIDDA